MHIWEDFGLPECFADHVLIGDAVVGQRLAPDRVEGVTQGLGPELISLNKETIRPGVNDDRGKSKRCLNIDL